MSSTLLWGFVGTLVPVMSNSLRKLPLMRRPWEHVMAFGGGVMFGKCVDSATVYMESNLERVRTSRAAAEAKIAVRRALAAEAAASPSSPPSSSTPATTSAASVDE
ncbi:hypothetical protein MMPV_001142 [Pyropia vietnamensis]